MFSLLQYRDHISLCKTVIGDASLEKIAQTTTVNTPLGPSEARELPAQKFNALGHQSELKKFLNIQLFTFSISVVYHGDKFI
jgi:hypothetical protein